MIYISHRGNLNGPQLENENTLDYVKKALLEFDVEIDVWNINDQYYLGHDLPKEKIDESFLENDRLWCHAKNFSALDKMLKNNKIHCFWHNDDTYTITSRGYIWTHSKAVNFNKSCIIVLPDNNVLDCLGICSNYIKRIKK